MHYLVETGQLQRLRPPGRCLGLHQDRGQLESATAPPVLQKGPCRNNKAPVTHLPGRPPLDHGPERIDGCQVLTAMLSLRAAPKGMSLCTKQETLAHRRLFSTPHPSAGWILRDIPKLLGPGGRHSRALRSGMVPSVSEGTSVRPGSWEFKLPTQCWAHTTTSTKAMEGTFSLV